MHQMLVGDARFTRHVDTRQSRNTLRGARTKARRDNIRQNEIDYKQMGSYMGGYILYYLSWCTYTKPM